ncbi:MULTISPECIES: O-antigen ligase family protein [Oscillospiraceae]|uniref:O-antigen ligase family protein n=1 Tax=Oscillospiraceae TaxID=216572 RepID=UPI001105844E|nr:MULTISPECIES: O-antigen ligase family protein [Oscillospiraceae]
MGKFTITFQKKKTYSVPQILICLLIIIIPLTSVLSSIIGIAGAIKDFICLLLCAYAVLKWRNQILWVSLCPILYFLLVILGAIFNDNIFESVRYRCEFAIAFALFFSALKLNKKNRELLIKSIIYTIYFIGVVVALIAVIEFFNPNLVHRIYGNNLTQHMSLIFGTNTSSRLISTMANPINLGLQMSISCAASLGLFFCDSTSRKSKIIYICSSLLFVWVIAFTYSRTAYFVVAVIFFSFLLLQLRTVKIQKKVLICAFGIIALVILYQFIMNNATLSARIGNISFQEFSTNIRFNRAVSAFEASDKTLWGYLFGFGIGDTVGESGQYIFEFGLASLLYETGIASLIIYIIVIVKAIISCRYILNQECYTLFEKVAASMFLSVILGFCAAMATEDVYMQLPYNMYLWLSVFVVERIKVDGRQTS